MLRVVISAISLLILLNLPSSIQADEQETPLKDDEGYLLVGISMKGFYYESITLDGGGSFWYAHEFQRDELNELVNYELIKLPEGKYFWKFIMLQFGRRYKFDKTEYPMTVEAGRVNYGGLFVGESLGTNRGSFKLLNRVTTAINIAEERYADLLTQYPMRFGAPGSDPFLGFYFSLPPKSESDE